MNIAKKSILDFVLLGLTVIILAGCGGGGGGSNPMPPGQPSPGALDTSFGAGGIVTTGIGTINDGGGAVGIQADGKIVVAGSSDTSTNSSVFALARYNTNGTLDTSFGIGGKVTTGIGTSYSGANAVAIQTDGKIVAAGYSYSITGSVFALARYNTNGTLDTSFGIGGKVTTSIRAIEDIVTAVAIQSDGKIVAAGYSYISGTATVFALARYNTNGTLDTSFGTGGKMTTAFGTSWDSAKAVVIQTDGKIVAAGSSITGYYNVYVFALARYNTDGTLDTSFGTGGKVTTIAGTYDNYSGASAVAIQRDGKIVAAGYSNTGTLYSVWALVQYNTDGTLDTSFGYLNWGIVTYSIGTINSRDRTTAVAIQTDGKIVTAGYSNSVFALARHNTNGTLDTSFGIGGKVTTGIGTSYSGASAVAIQTDGKIVAAGSSLLGTASAFALARYWP